MSIFIQGVLFFFNTEKKAVRNSSKKWLMSAICQVLSLMLFPSDQKIWPHFTLRAHTSYLEIVNPNGKKKILHTTQALTYVLKYSGSAKRAQPDQEWKDDVKG